MATQKKLCIFYLADDRRHFLFEKFVQYYSGYKYKDQTALIILTHTGDSEIYTQGLTSANIDGTVINVPGNDSNYLVKVEFAIKYTKERGIPYIMKHDNDILMSSHMYNFLFENLNVLEESKNLLLTPTLTSGIPTVDTFMKDFCDEEEKNMLGQVYRQYEFPDSLWGANYSSLNEFSVKANTWDGAKFWQGVSKINHHYKGIHPMRMSLEAIQLLNQCVIRHKDKIMGPLPDATLEFDDTSPYFCNSVFCMKIDTYDTIVHDRSLYRDGFDEVPVNLYRDKHKLNLVYTRKGCAIHFMYNCVTHYILYERMFAQQL